MIKPESQRNHAARSSQPRGTARPFFRAPVDEAALSSYHGVTLRVLESSRPSTSPSVQGRLDGGRVRDAEPAALTGSAGLDRAAWNRLLAFLALTHDGDAGGAYERMHARLVRFFATKGATHAEELADASLDRLARKLATETAGAIRNPMGYAIGVARLVWLETVKLEVAQRQRLANYEATRPGDSDEEDDGAGAREQAAARLDRCLDELGADERQLLLGYHQGEGHARIAARQALVRRLGLNPGLLRTRMCRLRAQLERRMRELGTEELAS